jgi:hypothetical protein
MSVIPMHRQTQISLSSTLCELGVRQSNPVYLQQAIEAAHKALEEFRAENDPGDFGSVQ